MRIDSDDWSEEAEIAELLKPLDELIAREGEKVKKLDELIREGEQKSKAVIPDPPT